MLKEIRWSVSAEHNVSKMKMKTLMKFPRTDWQFTHSPQILLLMTPSGFGLLARQSCEGGVGSAHRERAGRTALLSSVDIGNTVLPPEVMAEDFAKRREEVNKDSLKAAMRSCAFMWNVFYPADVNSEYILCFYTVMKYL